MATTSTQTVGSLQQRMELLLKGRTPARFSAKMPDEDRSPSDDETDKIMKIKSVEKIQSWLLTRIKPLRVEEYIMIWKTEREVENEKIDCVAKTVKDRSSTGRALVRTELLFLSEHGQYNRVVDLLGYEANPKLKATITEYLPMSLNTFLLSDDEKKENVDTLIKWAKQVLEALIYIHSKEYILHNLATWNVLLTNSDASKADVKLCGFEYTRRKEQIKWSRSSLPLPTEFTAPELVNADDGKEWGPACDMYSFACIVNLHYVRGPQRRGKDLKHNATLLRDPILRHTSLMDIHPAAIRYGLADCFRKIPSERKTAKEMLKIFENPETKPKPNEQLRAKKPSRTN